MLTHREQQVIALKEKFQQEVQAVLKHTQDIRDWLTATQKTAPPNPCNYCPGQSPKRD